jgi:penicillin-binding protein 1A
LDSPIDKKSSLKYKIFNSMLFSFGILICILIYIVLISKNLPSLDELQQFNPDQVSKIISSDGKVIKKLYIAKRDMVNISVIPKDLRNALLSMEDRDFYNHNGINLKGIIRAVIVDIVNLSAKQGASTLTQQLARTMYESIGMERSISRKIKEFITAIKIEQTYTKSEILELYLNSVYFGHGTYGVQSASIYYFSKDVSELNLEESAVLIGLLPAPAIYSPIKYPQRSDKRKRLVLKVMYSLNYINFEQYSEGIEKEISIRKYDYDSSPAPHYSEYVRRELEKIDEDLDISIYKDGLNIHTSLDSRIQNHLTESFNDVMTKNQKIFNRDLLANNKQLEMIAKKSNIELDSIKYILKNNLDIPEKLQKQLLVQGAAVVIDSKHGNILAMIGGRTEKIYLDHFNRATQANRQPGSVFKPFIYLSAIENGATPCTQLLNQPLVFFIDDTTRWNPQNHDGSTGLLTSLRDGIKKSLNLISVRVVQELITPKDVVNTAKRLGITTNIRPVDAIALGVSEVYPLNITMSYSAIANNGILHIPNPIVSIEDNDGRSIQEFMPYSKEVADEKEIFILRDMMKSVVDNGTGGSLRWKYKFYSPAAGKTGTTNSKADAWFIGFTPSITIGVWVGIDDPQMKLGEKQYGSNAAMPIFAKTINQIYDMGNFYLSGKETGIYKKEDWDIPEGIIEKNICKDTCCLNTDWCESYKEYFIETNAPIEKCEEFSNPLFRFKK